LAFNNVVLLGKDRMSTKKVAGTTIPYHRFLANINSILSTQIRVAASVAAGLPETFEAKANTTYVANPSVRLGKYTFS
jgi:hypothetical protein